MERNKKLVDIIRYFKTRNFLVLCKRIDQASIIKKMLKDKGEDVDIFTGTSRKFNRDSRILISTYSKTGVGSSMYKTTFNKLLAMDPWIIKLGEALRSANLIFKNDVEFQNKIQEISQEFRLTL